MLGSERSVAFADIDDLLKNYTFDQCDIGWESQTRSVALAPDLSSAAVGSIEGKIIILDRDQENNFNFSKKLEGGSLLNSSVTRCSFTPHKSFDITKGNVYYPVNSLAYHSNPEFKDCIISGGSDGKVMFFDVGIYLAKTKEISKSHPIVNVKLSSSAKYAAYGECYDYSKGQLETPSTQKKYICIEKLTPENFSRQSL